MSTLQLTFSDLYNAVARQLGTYGSSGPTGNNLTDAKEIVHSGYRKFLGAFDWSFTRKEKTLHTVSGTWNYELPEDFVHLIENFTFSKDDAFPPLVERTVEQIRDMRAISDWSGYPTYFAIGTGEYTPETGQRYEVTLYPAPDATYGLNYTYRGYPPKLSNNSDIPIGGTDMSECIKAFCLAEAESDTEEKQDVNNNKMAAELQSAIRRDIQRRPRTLGYNADNTRGGFGRDVRLRAVVFNT